MFCSRYISGCPCMRLANSFSVVPFTAWQDKSFELCAGFHFSLVLKCPFGLEQKPSHWVCLEQIKLASHECCFQGLFVTCRINWMYCSQVILHSKSCEVPSIVATVAALSCRVLVQSNSRPLLLQSLLVPRFLLPDLKSKFTSAV